jgi:hypothetical protein
MWRSVESNAGVSPIRIEIQRPCGILGFTQSSMGLVDDHVNCVPQLGLLKLLPFLLVGLILECLIRYPPKSTITRSKLRVTSQGHNHHRLILGTHRSDSRGRIQSWRQWRKGGPETGFHHLSWGDKMRGNHRRGTKLILVRPRILVVPMKYLTRSLAHVWLKVKFC